MGKYVELELAKMHLNVEEVYTEGDKYIELLIEVAEEKVAKELCVSVDDLATIDGGERIPQMLRCAILLYIGTFYANRESVSTAALKPVPHSVKEIIALYRNYSL